MDSDTNIYTELLKYEEPNAPDPDFLVVGMQKCGINWLGKLFQAHPELSVPGAEVHFFNAILGDLDFSPEAYSRRMSRLTNKNVLEAFAHLAPLLEVLDRATLLREFTRSYNSFIHRSRRSQTRLAGEISSNYVANSKLGLIDQIYPEIMKICIMRDPSDRIVSEHYHRLRAGRAQVGPITDQEVVTYCRRTVQELEHLISYDGEIHVLTYEQLSRHPEKTVAGIVSFLQIDNKPQLVERMVAAASFENQTGRSLGESDETQHLRKGVIGEGGHRLTPDQKLTTHGYLDDLNRQLMDKFQLDLTGYLADPQHAAESDTGSLKTFGFHRSESLFMSRSDCLIFYHIPNTAGTTFSDILKREYGLDHLFHLHARHRFDDMEKYRSMDEREKEQIDVITGHLSHVLEPDVPKKVRYVTFLREPISQCQSSYHYIIQTPHNPHHELVKKLGGIEPFLDYQVETKQNSTQTRFLSDATPYFARETGETMTLTDKSGEECFKKAMQRLENIEFVFLTEGFDQAMLVLEKELDSPESPSYQRLNESKRTNDVSKETTNKIREVHKYDFLIYEEAQRRHQNHVNSMGSDFQKRVKEFQEGNRAPNDRARSGASVPADAYQPDIGEKLTLLDPDFAGIAMQPNKSANWQWSGGVDFVKLIEADNGLQLGLEFASSEERTFLVSGAGTGRLTRPADNARSYRLPSKAQVTVEVWVPKLTPYARVGLYFIEYDLELRVGTSKFRLREGKNVLQLKTRDDVYSFRIAFRLAGTGTVAIDRVLVRALKCTL